MGTALVQGFELLEVSEEVKQLDAYVTLQSQKQAFDDYVLRRGFDQQAADTLIDMRSSLDRLTRELQQRRSADAAAESSSP